MAEQPTCFVISPIGKEGSDIRRRADKLFTHVLTPIAIECGYIPLRADKISEPGIISTQVINHILTDAMVIADLTGPNANVFYELAVRHASRKPFVQIIQKGETIPFDLAGVRTIEIDHQDLDSVSEAKIEIKKQIDAGAINPSGVENPISAAINLDKLNRSDDPVKRELGDILQAVTDLRTLIEKRLRPRVILRRENQEQPKEGTFASPVIDIMAALKDSLARQKADNPEQKGYDVDSL